MSSDLMNESYFSNGEIPVSEKAGLIALLLGGTYDKNALSIDGKDQSFVSMVYKRGGGITPVIYTYGHPESLSFIACKSLLHNAGLDSKGNVDNLFDGSMQDRDVINYVFDVYKTYPNIDKTKFKDDYENLIKPKLLDYFEKLKQYDKFIADNPKLMENLLGTIEEAYTSGAVRKDVAKETVEVEPVDKKKQLTEETPA